MGMLEERQIRQQFSWMAAAAFLLLYTAWLLLVPYSLARSYPFQLFAVWCTVATCALRALKVASSARLSWSLVSAGLALWAVGLSISAWEDVYRHLLVDIAHASDLAYLLYGVPMLLAISLPANRREANTLLWLDGLQSAITALVLYVALFSSLPFVHGSSEPMVATLVARTYNWENILLLCAAALRLSTHKSEGEYLNLYRILTQFLAIYAICAAWYNHVVIEVGVQTGIHDELVVLPFVILSAQASKPLGSAHKEEEPRSEDTFSRLLDNTAPLLYTVALLVLGAFVFRTHFFWGTLSLVLAVAAYIIRATVTQNRLLHSELELRRARDELKSLSLTDGLTGVANRRCFDLTLDDEWRRIWRSHSCLSLLLIDIDHFKAFNDRFGHQAGDACLKEVAKALRGVLPREKDLVARYGGEEFAVILVDTSASGAREVAELLRATIAALKITGAPPTRVSVTVSIGVSTCGEGDMKAPEELVKLADIALYRAKAGGRDRINEADV